MIESKVQLLIYSFVTFLFNACGGNGLLGVHDLGNNLTLLEGDKKEDRIIVYCTNGGQEACRGGIAVVPSQERHYDRQGRYAEYITEAKSNDKIVVAKTIEIKDKKENYWIVNKEFTLKGIDCDKMNCDSIIQSHVIGPMNAVDFENKMKQLKMNLTLNK